MSQFEQALDYVLQREGGIDDSSKNPNDFSKCGITLGLLKEFDREASRKYSLPPADLVEQQDVEKLTPEQISAIYKGEFWDHAPFDKVRDQDLCNYLFDACINMRLAPAIKCLQRAYWACAQDRTTLIDDGILGEITLTKINMVPAYHIIAAMRSERAGEYRLIVQKHPEKNCNLEGWLNRSYNLKT